MMQDFKLILIRQRQNLCQNRRNRQLRRHEHRMQPDTSKHPHKYLAIHSISDPSMSRDRVSKILNLKSSLNTRCKEPSKRCNEPSKESKYHGIDFQIREQNFITSKRDHFKILPQQVPRVTSRSSKRHHRDIVLRTKQELKLSKKPRNLNKTYQISPKYSRNKSSNKPFKCFIRRKFNQRSPSKQNPEDISGAIIDYD